MMNPTEIYPIYIYERFRDLKNSTKTDFDNNDLWKIFEYYVCLKLSKDYNQCFYVYDDIDPNFKEINRMSRSDTGIDACNLTDTIVQVKLRKTSLTLQECATFFMSAYCFDKESNKKIFRWDKLIIARNDDCKLSHNLSNINDLFIDNTYSKKELIDYCESLIINPPKYPDIKDTNIQLRDYQLDCIKLITENVKNIIISLPTGTGKNIVIIHSIQNDKKYLILVPRIILMEQLKDEIIKHKPHLKKHIQMMGDGKSEYNEKKNITICVFNSVANVEKYFNEFEKIYIDEAHHIYKPEIYQADEEESANDVNEQKEEIVINEGKQEIDTDNVEKNDDEDSQEIDDENSDIDDESESDEEESEEDSNEEESKEEESKEEEVEEEMKDDSEDEMKDVKTFTKIIRELSKYNNNVYLSATIDERETEGFIYYKKDIREMIEKGYLCDYTIHIPVFNDDPTNKNICEYLIKQYRNIIVYCSSMKEGKSITKIFNELQKNSAEYVDCKTSKTKRNDILNKFKNGQLSFLVNVRVLTEGYDAPITKGVCFMHMPSNMTTQIQIIGRALRLHPGKQYANIILPYSVNDDEKGINKFMRTVAKNDKRIMKSYVNISTSGYISIDKTDDIMDSENKVVELRYEMIYNNLGKLRNEFDIWKAIVNNINKYINDNNKRPSLKDKDKHIKIMAQFIKNNMIYYKYNNHNYKLWNVAKRDIWIEFINKNKKYFISNTERWLSQLNLLSKYIDEHNKLPLHSSNLGQWYVNQLKKKHNNIIEWEKFNKKYEIYLLDNIGVWEKRINLVSTYILQYNKRPSQYDTDKNIKELGVWLGNQLYCYDRLINIMKNKYIKEQFESFIKKYNKFFINKDEQWNKNFLMIKSYIDINNKRPSVSNKDKNISIMGIWIKNQLKYYTKKTSLMKKDSIRKQWEDFITNNKYKKYFT